MYAIGRVLTFQTSDWLHANLSILIARLHTDIDSGNLVPEVLNVAGQVLAPSTSGAKGNLEFTDRQILATAFTIGSLQTRTLDGLPLAFASAFMACLLVPEIRDCSTELPTGYNACIAQCQGGGSQVAGIAIPVGGRVIQTLANGDS